MQIKDESYIGPEELAPIKLYGLSEYNSEEMVFAVKSAEIFLHHLQLLIFILS